MSWARFDDRYDDNRKVKRAWRRHPRAVGLHAMAITYSTRHQTDGIVDLEWVEEKLPSKVDREKVLVVLLGAGLLERLDDEHFVVHDFLDYNESREEREAARAEERQRKSAAGRKGGLAKAAKARSQAETPNGSGSSGLAPASALVEQAPGSPSSASVARTAPHHTTPTTTSSSEDVEPSRLDAARERVKAGEDGVRLCDLLAELILANDPKAKVAPDGARWLKDMRLLIADRDGDVAEVERVLRWSQGDSFWWSNILSPGKLREQFTRLRGKMPDAQPAARREASMSEALNSRPLA